MSHVHAQGPATRVLTATVIPTATEVKDRSCCCNWFRSAAVVPVEAVPVDAVASVTYDVETGEATVVPPGSGIPEAIIATAENASQETAEARPSRCSKLLVRCRPKNQRQQRRQGCSTKFMMGVLIGAPVVLVLGLTSGMLTRLSPQSGSPTPGSTSMAPLRDTSSSFGTTPAALSLFALSNES